RTSQTTVGIQVSNGVPSSVAWLVNVDPTNFDSATWTAYAPNMTVNLGWQEGWHEVWVALRGRAADSQQTWVSARFNYDHTPPQLVITGPTNNVVAQPMIQLRGYCPEPLSHLHYDITNAAGWFTYLPVQVVDQTLDTNMTAFTTNTFQAFDVELTNDLNTITLYATDLAGNTSVLTTNITLDYTGKTAPVVKLFWPQDGTQIGGSDFTW